MRMGKITYIYFLRMRPIINEDHPTFFKIGFSESIFKRISSFECQNIVEVVRLIKCRSEYARPIERVLLKRYKPNAVLPYSLVGNGHTECFSFNNDELQVICEYLDRWKTACASDLNLL